MGEKDLLVLRRLKGVLTELLGKSGWEESILLSVSKRKIKGLLEQCESMLAATEEQVQSSEPQVFELLANQKAVYVSLFQMQGQLLSSWETALLALPACSLGRPVYAEEADVRAFVDSRPIHVREGYVKLAISDHDILRVPDGRRPQDPLGKDLLTLRPDGVHVHNIMMFVHGNEQRYAFRKGQLLPYPDESERA